jgi:hypothetical protein
MSTHVMNDKDSCLRCNDRYDLVASLQSTFPLARVAHLNLNSQSTSRHIEAFERGVLSHGQGGLLHSDSIISQNNRMVLELSINEIIKSTSNIKKVTPKMLQMHLSSVRNMFTDMYRQTGEFRNFNFLFIFFLPLSQGIIFFIYLFHSQGKKCVCMNHEQWVERKSNMMSTPQTVLR